MQAAVTTTTSAVPPAKVRLIEGMTVSVIEKGYPATTIADIAREARVSKRTFYEHFADKQDCFLAVYSAASDMLLEVIANAAGADLPWERRLYTATLAYLAALEQQPALTRTLFTEISSVGAAAVRMRRTVLVRFADLLRVLVHEGRGENPDVRELSAPLAMALVGGINELVLQWIEDGNGHRLTALVDTLSELVHAVLTAGPGRGAGCPE